MATWLLIILGLVFYFFYKKGYIIKKYKKSEDTKKYILKKAKEKLNNKEIDESEYHKIKDEINNS